MFLEKAKDPSKYLIETLFEPGQDWWNNAHLDYAPCKFTLYAEGYQRAADILINFIDNEAHSQDFLVYPIIFLYRHSIELKLKNIIETGRKLLDEKGSYPNHHNLDSLWQLSKNIAIKVWPKGDISELQQAETYINTLTKIDPASYSFRYPFTKKGDVSLPELELIP